MLIRPERKKARRDEAEIRTLKLTDFPARNDKHPFVGHSTTPPSEGEGRVSLDTVRQDACAPSSTASDSDALQRLRQEISQIEEGRRTPARRSVGRTRRTRGKETSSRLRAEPCADPLSAEREDPAQEFDWPSWIRSRALWSLSYRETTRAHLKESLLAKAMTAMGEAPQGSRRGWGRRAPRKKAPKTEIAHIEKIIEDALNLLEKEGFLSDLRYVEMKAFSSFHSGKSANRILRECREKAANEDSIRNGMALAAMRFLEERCGAETDIMPPPDMENMSDQEIEEILSRAEIEAARILFEKKNKGKTGSDRAQKERILRSFAYAGFSLETALEVIGKGK